MLLYPGLKQFVEHGLQAGVKTGDLYVNAVNKFKYRNTSKAFSVYTSKIKRGLNVNVVKSKEIEEISEEELFLNTLKKQKNMSLVELADIVGCTSSRIIDYIDYYRGQGYEILYDEDKVALSFNVTSQGDKIDTLEEQEIIFGVASDLHIGSKQTQITALNKFCDICKKEGVKYMFTPGDVCAGYNVYPGQLFDLYAISAEEQEESVVVNLPKGLEWFMIGGNHDYSFVKKGGGHNPLLAIENKRDDVHYIAFDDGDVPILPGVDLKMFHPSGGVPYSLSYRIQKTVEQITSYELVKIVSGVKPKPTIRFLMAGHLHVQMQGLFGSLFAAQVGCFEGQTNYLKRKGLIPAVGGYIIKATLKKGGLLRYEAPFYLFPEIEDDWKNYSHSIPRQKITKPIFS